MTGSRSKFAGAVFVALFVFAVYLRVLRGGFLLWDDRELLVNHSAYRGFDPMHLWWMITTFKLGHWQPLSWLSYALDYKIWGLNSSGWHLTNLLLHTVNAVFVYLLCLQFSGRVWQKPVLASAEKSTVYNYVPAVLATLFWALHPLRVEVVAWLATRGYLLCTMFCLLTVLFYIRESDRRRYPWSALFCFTLAFCTKGIGMMLPPVLLILDFFLFRKITSVRTAFRCILEKIPFFVLALFNGVLAFLAKKAEGGMLMVDQYTWPQRLGQAVCGIWFYLKKTVIPHPLLPLYDKQADLQQIQIAVAMTAASGLLLFLFRRKLQRITGSIAVFLLLMFPLLGITQSGIQLYADRFTYLAAVPFSILLNALLRRRKTLQAILTVCLVVWICICWQQIPVWNNTASLFEHALKFGGDSVTARNNIGRDLAEQGHLAEATEHFLAALRLRPDDPMTHQNLAVVLMQQGRFKEAEKEGRELIRLQPGNVVACSVLGAVLAQEGRLEEAELYYKEALRLSPACADTCRMLAVVLAAEGKGAEAVKHYHAARRLNSASVDARNAAEKNPAALNNLAWLLATGSDPAKRDGAEAVKLAEQACKLAENKAPGLLDTLAAAYAEAGRFEEAVKAAEQAAELARSNGNGMQAQKIETRLELYRQNKPYRE